jgi:alkylation response protein AidB-like acyl-CoA dehydrogenase
MSLSEAEKQLLDAARDLKSQIESFAHVIDRNRRLPETLVASLARAGLFRMIVPRSLGGCEASLPVVTEVLEEIAKADASTAWCLGQNNGITWIAGHMRRDAAEAVFQPDARFAWGQGPSRVTAVPGGYRVTGEWRFASGIRHATWVGAHNSPLLQEDGTPLLAADGSREVCTVMFPADQAEILDVWQVSGLRGTASDTYRVADLFVPERFRVLDEPQEPGPMYRIGTTNIFQAGFAHVALGIARAALDAIIDMSITKTPRGMSGVLREQPTFQSQVGQAEATWSAARAFLRQTVHAVWDGVCATREFTLEQRVRLRLASTHAIRSAAQVTDSAYYLAGGNAIFDDNPFERRFRDMHAVTQQVQGRYDHYESAGKFLLGLEPDTQFL